MKVALLTFGTRGDVQPFVAYAVGLKKAGYEPYLIAPRNNADFAAAYGIPFRPMSVNVRQLIDLPEVQEIIESGNLRRFFKHEGWSFVQRVVCLDAWNLTDDAEAMIFRIGAPSLAFRIAQARKIPSVEISYVPMEPSAEVPPLGGGGAGRRSAFYNRLVGEITCRYFWRTFTAPANFIGRNVLNMPPMPRAGPLEEYRRAGHPTFYIFSPNMIPKPRDWRPDAHVVGNLFLDEPPDWTPPRALVEFLAAGPKPVFIAFGSMPCENPQAREEAILAAIRRLGVRAIVQGTFGGHGDGVQLSETVFSAGPVPYNWLLPQMAMMVHHGGVGTTGEALRAGIPSVVVPHAFEQPYWARRSCEMGVCPEPIPWKQFSAERLAAAIQAVLSNRAMQERAAELGARVRAENGVTRAVELFGEYVERYKAKAT